jgi:hypothetical protein
MYIHSDEYEKNKNVSGGKFNNSKHPYTVTTYSGGGGDYKLTVNKQTIYSEKNSNNNYTLLTIKVWYLLPAHEQHRSWEWVTVDKPVFSDPSKDITLYCGGNDGFWENSYHDTQEHWKSVNIHVSTGLVGVSSADRDGWKTYDWCSINLNLEKPSRSIYYNGNGGDGADVTWNFTDGDNFSFPNVSRRGYTLTGWLDEGTKWMSNTGWLGNALPATRSSVVVQEMEGWKAILLFVVLLLLMVCMLLPYILGAITFARIVMAEFHQIQEEREQQQREFDRKRNLMLSDIAHDLRTPVTTVSGYAKALADHMVQEPEKQQEYLNAIQNKSHRPATDARR